MPSIINWNETSQTLNDLCVDFLLELLFRSGEEGCRGGRPLGRGCPGWPCPGCWIMGNSTCWF